VKLLTGLVVGIIVLGIIDISDDHRDFVAFVLIEPGNGKVCVETPVVQPAVDVPLLVIGTDRRDDCFVRVDMKIPEVPE